MYIEIMLKNCVIVIPGTSVITRMSPEYMGLYPSAREYVTMHGGLQIVNCVPAIIFSSSYCYSLDFA